MRRGFFVVCAAGQAREYINNLFPEQFNASVKHLILMFLKPISRHFGKHKGIFNGDGVAYQRVIRDEWNCHQSGI